MEPNRSSEYILAAQRIQEKFNFYFLALTFTLAGLAVQTASFGDSIGANVAELAGWLGLVLSGLFGMHRLNDMAHLYKLHADREQHVEGIRTIREAAATGTRLLATNAEGRPVSLQEAFESHEIGRLALGEIIEEEKKGSGRAYTLQRWCFLIGLGALMVSRAWAPVAVMIQQLF